MISVSRIGSAQAESKAAVEQKLADAKASAARQAATGPVLAALAKRYLDTAKASVILVGPREQLLPQLRSLDRGEPAMWTPEGYPAK